MSKYDPNWQHEKPWLKAGEETLKSSTQNKTRNARTAFKQAQ